MKLDSTHGIIVFTDGSASTKTRAGGWGWVAMDAFEGRIEGAGSAEDTTISRMELMAPIDALEAIEFECGPCEILILSDSQYVVLGFMNKDRARRKNVELWDCLEECAARHTYVDMEHVRGHRGHVWNERADKLAVEARKSSEAASAAGGK